MEQPDASHIRQESSSPNSTRRCGTEYTSCGTEWNRPLSSPHDGNLASRLIWQASGLLDAGEFEDAFERLTDEIVGETLALLGISATTLYLNFLGALAVLLGGLAFVFCGTTGFGGPGLGETFDLVINSLLAVAAGGVGFKAGFDKAKAREAIGSRKQHVFNEVFERYTL